MIRGLMLGFYDNDFPDGGTRNGDSLILEDDFGNVEVIDGYCGKPADRLVKRLKNRKVKKPWLHITHPHYDHYNGIEKILNDSYFTPRGLFCPNPNSYNRNFSKECASNIDALERIIRKAKAKKIPITFLNNGDRIIHGDIKINVYRKQPKTAENTDAYLNDGSLCYWFSELLYLTTGDAGLGVAKREGLEPVFIKGGHHGNDISGDDTKPSVNARFLYNNGCLYYWDNDYSTKLTDFLMTGREDAQNAGMKIFDIHGDINFVAYGGKVVIYKDGKNYQYPCMYKGKSKLKMADLTVVYDTMIGKYGNGESRVTALIDAGYYPSNVQNWINKLRKAFKG